MENEENAYKNRLDKLADDIALLKVREHKLEEKLTSMENMLEQLKQTLAEIKRRGGAD